jgi:integrase/recombinase XerD
MLPVLIRLRLKLIIDVIMNNEAVQDFIQGRSSAETRRAYRYDLERFFEFLERTTDVDTPAEVTRESVRVYVRALRLESLSVSTKRRRIAAVRQFFDWLREKGAIPFNPVPGSVSFDATPDNSQDPARVLDRDALSAVLNAIDRDSVQGQRDYTLVLVVVYGALRRSEVASLDVDDVRPLGRHWVIDLSAGAQPQGGYVPVPGRVAEQVQRLASLYDEEEGPLWRSLSNRNRGDRLTPDALYKIVRRVGQEAGADDLNIDGLRRSGLRLASANGASLGQLRRHARLQTTASTVKYTAEDSGGGRLTSSVSDRIPLDLVE